MRNILFLLFLFSTQSQALNILASGQSNMCGRGTGGPSPLTANPLVSVWNNANYLVSDGDAFISPPALGNPPWTDNGGNNLALWFADAAADTLNEEVNLILVCKGSQSINEWGIDDPMYGAVVRIYQATGLPPADVMLWHQGEADSTMTSCNYKLRLFNLVARLRAAGVLAYTAPVIMGELRYAPAQPINQALANIPTGQPDMYFVEADGLPDFDDVHYTGQALHDFGLRYWDAYAP